MNQNELQTENTEINDLSVTDGQQAEIKGGPKRIFIGGLSVKDSATLADLEPQGDVVGGLPAVQKVREAANRSQAAHGSGGGAGKVSMQDIHFTL